LLSAAFASPVLQVLQKLHLPLHLAALSAAGYKLLLTCAMVSMRCQAGLLSMPDL